MKASHFCIRSSFLSLLVVILSIYSPTTYAQQSILRTNNVDSLNAYILESTQYLTDSAQANFYNHIAQIFQYSYPDTALFFTKKALEKNQYKYKRIAIQSCILASNIEEQKGDIPKALSHLWKVNTMPIKNPSYLGVLLLRAGELLSYTFDNTTPTAYYLQAINLFSSVDDSVNIVFAYTRLAKNYKQNKQDSVAKQFYINAHTIAVRNELKSQSIITLQLASFLLDIGELEKAYTYLDATLAKAKSKNDYTIVAKTLLLSSRYHKQTGNLKQAEEDIHNAFLAAEHLNKPFLVSKLNLELGIVYYEQETYQRALPLLLEAEKGLSPKHINTLQKTYTTLTSLFNKIDNQKKALLYQEKTNALLQHTITTNNSVMRAYSLLQNRYKSDQKNNHFAITPTLTTCSLNQTYLQYLLLILFIIIVLHIFLIRQKIAKKRALKKQIQHLEARIKKGEKSRHNNNKTTELLSEEEKKEVRLKRIYDDMITLFEKEKVYVNPNLTLLILAEKLNTNRIELSEAIHTYTKRTYPVLINEYRVIHAINLLSESHHKYTIESIAYDSGFSSSSNFYKYFKNYTGVTPNIFIQNQD